MGVIVINCVSFLVHIQCEKTRIIYLIMSESLEIIIVNGRKMFSIVNRHLYFQNTINQNYVLK